MTENPQISFGASLLISFDLTHADRRRPAAVHLSPASSAWNPPGICSRICSRLSSKLCGSCNRSRFDNGRQNFFDQKTHIFVAKFLDDFDEMNNFDDFQKLRKKSKICTFLQIMHLNEYTAKKPRFEQNHQLICDKKDSKTHKTWVLPCRFFRQFLIIWMRDGHSRCGKTFRKNSKFWEHRSATTTKILRPKSFNNQ